MQATFLNKIHGTTHTVLQVVRGIKEEEAMAEIKEDIVMLGKGAT